MNGTNVRIILPAEFISHGRIKMCLAKYMPQRLLVGNKFLSTSLLRQVYI